MQNKDILSLKIQETPKRVLRVTEANIKEVKVRGDSRHKVVFNTVEESTGKQFEISDVWIKGKTGEKRVGGLWLTLVDDQINQASSLAKLLKHYNSPDIGSMVDKEVVAFPDENNFLVISAV